MAKSKKNKKTDPGGEFDFSANVDYDPRTHFVVHIYGDSDRDAYDHMLSVSALDDKRVFKAAVRGYKRLMRSVDESIRDMIESRIDNMRSDQPIYVINAGEQWIFFGAYGD